MIFLLVMLLLSFLPSVGGFFDALIRRLLLGVVVAAVLLAALVTIRQAFERI